MLHDTVVHDHDLVAHLHRFQLVMGHINRGRSHTIMLGAQFLRHVFAKLGIQSAQRLIHEERLWFSDDGATQCHPLPVPA